MQMRNGQAGGASKIQSNLSKVSGHRSAKRQATLRRIRAAVAVSALLFECHSLIAADTSWILAANGSTTSPTAITGGGTGSWDVGANWQGGVTPNTAGRANIDNGGTVLITQSETTNNDVTVGGYQNSTAGQNGSSGTYVQTAGSMVVSGWFRMAEGYQDVGTYQISGGSFTTGGQFNLGEGNSSTGTFTMTAGANATASVTGNVIQFGGAAGAVGTLNIGSTNLFSSTVTAVIGYGTSGTGIINDNGAFNISGSGSNLELANATNSSGFFNLSGGVANVAGQTFLGNAAGAVGVMNISNGTYNAGNWIAIGRTNSTGILNIMAGGTVNYNAANGGNITFAGLNNTLNLMAGGTLINTAASTFTEGGTSVFNLSGGTATLANFSLAQNSGTSMTVNLYSGSVLTVSSIGKVNATSTGIFNFLGGTLASRASSTAWFGALTSANVSSAGAFFNTNGFNDTVSQALLHSGSGTDGGLTLNDTSGTLGKLDLTGTNTYTGPTNIIAGNLEAFFFASLPNYNTPGYVTIGNNAGITFGVGGTSGLQFSSAMVDSVRATANFQGNATLGFDTTNGTFTYASTIGSTTNGTLGVAVYGNSANPLVLSGSNTYTGNTTVGNGGYLTLGSAENPGVSGPIGEGSTLTFIGTTELIYSAVNSYDYSGRFNTVASTNFAVNTPGGTSVNFANPLVIGGTTGTGQFNKYGTGTLTLNGANKVSQYFLHSGTTVLASGSSLTTTSYNDIGAGNGDYATLTLQGNATLTSAGDFNISDVASSTGILNITGTSSVTTTGGTGIYVGKSGSSTGLLNMTGGTLTDNQGGDAFRLGGSGGTGDASAVGFMTVSSGIINDIGSIETGYYGTGYLTMTGGTLTSATYPDIARQTNSWGLDDINGGTFNQNNSATRLIVGELGSGYMVIRGGGVVNSTGGVTLTQSAGATAVLTLGAGGTLTTPYVSSLTGPPTGTLGAGTGIINFNGGELQASAGSANASTNFMSGLTGAYVFGGGAIIDTTNGNITIPQPLLAPAGQGLTSIALNSSGSGYITAPAVKITGGGGIGATAVANLNSSGGITGFTILNPGTGYTSAPTITLVTGLLVPSSAATVASASIGNSSSGGLTVQGGNTLTLTGTSTYTGTTTISSGTLQLGNGTTDGSISATSNVVNNGMLSYNLLANRTVSYPITGTGGLTVNNTGATYGNITLSAADTFSGPTSITNANLTINALTGTGTLSNTSSFTLNSANTLFVHGTTGIGNNSGGSVSLANTATVDMRDATVNTLNIGGNLTLSNNTIDLDLGGTAGSIDSIVTGGSVSANGTNMIFINPLSSVVNGNYVLLDAVGGGLTPGGGGFSLGTAPTGFTQYSLSNSTSNEVILTITTNSTPSVEYWTGAASAAGGDPNNWGFGATLSTPQSNWSNNSSGTSDPHQVPGAITDVYFTATNAVVSSGAVNSQLDTNYSIKGLFFNTTGATTPISSVSINTNTDTLTIGADGLTVVAGDNSSTTITGTGAVLVGGNETWANNSAQPLSITAPIAGTSVSGAQTLNFNSAGTGSTTLSGGVGDGTGGGNLNIQVSGGTLTLGGSNTFTGGVNISGGILHVLSSAAMNTNAPQGVNFTPGSTGDLQLAGVSVTTGALSSTTGTPIVENANATAAVLTVNVSSGSSTYAGVIQDGVGGGTMGLAKTGAGTQILTGNSTFSGPVSVNQGDLVIGSANALGNASGSFEVFSGGSAIIPNGTTYSGRAVTINGLGDGTGNGALAIAPGNTATYASPIVVGDPAMNASTARITGGAGLTLPGVITAGVTSGTSGLQLEGNFNFTSTSNMSAPTLILYQAFTTTPSTITVSGGNLNFDYIRMGNTGATGLVTNTNWVQTGGTVNASTYFVVGYDGPLTSTSTLNLSGGSLNTLTSTTMGAGNLEVGTYDNNTATLLLSGSGAVNAQNNSAIVIGAQSSSAANTFNQTGGTVNFFSDSGVTLGGTGALIIGGGGTTGTNSYYLNGGTLNAAEIYKTSTGGTGNFYFNGGLLAANQNSSTGTPLMGNSGTGTYALTHAYVQAGGAIINTNNYNATITQPLLHDATAGAPAVDGGIIVNAGTGSLELTGGGSTFTGNVNIASGTLICAVSNPNSNNPVNGILGNDTVARLILVNPGTTLNFAVGNVLATGNYNPSLVTMNISSGTLINTSGDTETLGVLNLNNATVTASSGTGNASFQSYTLNDTITVTGNTQSVFSTAGGTNAGYHVGSGSNKNVTFNIDPAGTGASLLVSANLIPGSGGGQTGSAITLTGLGTLYLTGSNTYNGGTFVNSGTLNLAGPQSFPAQTNLTIAAGGTTVISDTQSGPYGIRVGTFSNAGLVDVTDNDIVIHNVSSGTIGSVMSQLQSGYNNGNWNGTTGILSSEAAADPTHLTAVGAMINDTTANSTGVLSGTRIYSSIDGTATTDGDILVKETYYGDANLDGQVDGSDYSLIDNGYLSKLTGWYNGDFNYDGVINGSDYTLIDNAYNTQGFSMASEIAGSPTAQVAGSSSVPEPATLGLIGIGAVGLLGRRTRRQPR